MLPSPLQPLHELAHNLWWSWDTEATALWRSVDAWRWERDRHNPIALLQDVEDERWTELAADPTFMRRLRTVHQRFQSYLKSAGWATETHPRLRNRSVAYFSMEFGLHQALRIYSGGLGVLAGDHIRSASDLGVPMVGVTLMYGKGYFRQVIDDGVQLDAYVQAQFDRLPIQAVEGKDGNQLQVKVTIDHRKVTLKVWRLDVGRARLYLLDSNHVENAPVDRALTDHLYGGTQRTRIAQEVLLGIGGLRTLRAVGEAVDLYHLNEGHCAFVPLELAREQMEETGVSWPEALEVARSLCVFTTHTPVAAGHDYFHWDVVNEVLGTWRDEMGLEPGTFMDLGRLHPGDWSETLCMTVLALRTSARANGVSALHGEVSRTMWRDLWPQIEDEDQVPIGHITNGVHPIFWCAPPTRGLFDRHLSGWRQTTWSPELWSSVDEIPSGELWELRNMLRARLVREVNSRTGLELRPDALTIGFARRFATYKRGDLVFRHADRLADLLEGQPGVQLVFAGKAHPQDGPGKQLVANVIKWSNSRRFRNRVAFLEDYDMALGHLLTSGADVWLNNPRRPREASGTSGQKVVLNGGLNLSVLDGWWPEGFDGANGWAIGDGTMHTDLDAGDRQDAESLIRTLEEDVLPLWNARDAQGVPVKWLERVRQSLKTCAPAFNSHRMVRDYVQEMYLPLLAD